MSSAPTARAPSGYASVGFDDVSMPARWPGSALAAALSTALGGLAVGAGPVAAERTSACSVSA